jgi:RNA recognition motif-containing protein
MSAKIFVGNLNPRTTRSQLAQFFAAVGRVESIRIPLDRNTGKPRGFCFVEFADADTAQKAITLHDRSELDGQQLRLSWAREREENGAGRAGRTLRPAPDALPRNETKDYRETLVSQESLWSDDYRGQRGAKPRRHGKHGSDRKHRHGTRRVID